ncbi:MAG: DegT/DnrJ/EryC1/StrS family aminotransferase [Candidatus Niyogibacteria bacterium]|nr:DegT/DnrJ/EryC1/StrS family aminotransferase [Candidatus Niyogibacteria bacterium]
MHLHFFKKSIIALVQKLAVKRAVSRVIEKDAKDGSIGRFYTNKFEILLSERLNNISTLGTASGTDALILALKALKIGAGDEVIVPAFSCIPPASSISWVGATPIFVDIRDDDYAIDPAMVEKKISSKTKAIIVAHLFGQPTGRIKRILDIARQRRLFVIEDAAQSFGAKVEIDGKWSEAGTIGDIGCLSFSSTKIFAAPGNAGAVIVKDPYLVEEIDRMRLFGTRTRYYDYPTVGISAKIQEIHAAILLAKLPFFNYWLEHRRKLAFYYKELLYNIGDIILPQNKEKTERVWYRFVIRTQKRDELFKYLRTSLRKKPHLKPMIHYPVPLPYFSAFKTGYKRGNFPVSDQISSEMISLPLNNSMSKGDTEFVCQTIKAFFNTFK